MGSNPETNLEKVVLPLILYAINNCYEVAFEDSKVPATLILIQINKITLVIIQVGQVASVSRAVNLADNNKAVLHRR